MNTSTCTISQKELHECSDILSHKNGDDDTHLTETAACVVAEESLIPYVAERDLQPGENLWAKIDRNISQSACVVGILTARAADSRVVHAEIAAARAYGKEVVLLVEHGVEVPLSELGREHIPFDRANPNQAFDALRAYLRGVRAWNIFWGLLLAAGAVWLGWQAVKAMRS
ncbi:MAG TPA: toll/interleukin-1 receptor domain-containing protein [bacterium]